MKNKKRKRLRRMLKLIANKSPNNMALSMRIYLAYASRYGRHR
jgi:hypothetical protein